MYTKQLEIGKEAPNNDNKYMKYSDGQDLILDQAQQQ
jgi:hypothetical protein